jgi:hypothetical protein
MGAGIQFHSVVGLRRAMKVAPLDDYQNVAPSRADWSGATKRAVTSALRDNVADRIASSRLHAGRPTALTFAREGARLVISGRRDEVGHALVEELRPYVRDAFWGGDERNYIDFPVLE